jgi:hypothetical protein
MNTLCYLLVLLTLLFLTQIHADCLGQIQITGEPTTYIMAGSPEGLTVSGTQLQLKHNRGATYTAKCQNNFDPNVFGRFYVLDHTLSFTTDVSSVSCGCNAALYFVLMPAYNQSQQPDPSTCGNYYCDANQVCGLWCPEFDLMEANRAGFAITPHKCDNPTGKWYPHCDGRGCSIQTKTMGNNYGYGANFIINTQNEFNVSISFQSQGGVLAQVVTTLSQQTRKFTVTHNQSLCGAGYLAALTDAFKQGWVLTASHWSGANGGTMSWLDVPPCDINENCDPNGTAVFKDLVIRPN